MIILAIIVTLACLKTAIGLVTSASETFVKIFPKFLPYRAWAVIFSIVSFLIANVGLTSIIAYAVPVLMFLYPLAITLILLGLFGNTFKHRRCIYVSTTSFTLVAAIFDLIAALPASVVAKLHAEATLAFMSKYVPLFKYGMGWLIPALVGLAIGIIYALATKKQAAWRYDICNKDTSVYTLESADCSADLTCEREENPDNSATNSATTNQSAYNDEAYFETAPDADSTQNSTDAECAPDEA